jgi:uncharacterized small protein (DUF1192 family)
MADSQQATDDILAAVQAIIEMAQADFVAAAAGMDAGRWHGLDADTRGRLSRKAREEVKRLTALFACIRAEIDATPGAALSPAELERRIAERRAELERLQATERALDAMLPPAAGAEG